MDGSFGRYRAALVSHLHAHPDHAGFYKAGHDFVLRPAADVEAGHERWHGERSTFVTRRHAAGLRTGKEKEEGMPKRKTLDLKVTVSGEQDPDAVLAAMLRQGPHPRPGLMLLQYGVNVLDVTSVERADGREIGLEAEFEAWWEREQDPDDTTACDASHKDWAKDAFMHGVAYGRKRV